MTLYKPAHETWARPNWSIPDCVDASDTHDTVQGGVLVNSIAQFLHLVKAKIEKTLWEKLYVRFGSKADLRVPQSLGCRLTDRRQKRVYS
jgi:hypothetical protein